MATVRDGAGTLIVLPRPEVEWLAITVLILWPRPVVTRRVRPRSIMARPIVALAFVALPIRVRGAAGTARRLRPPTGTTLRALLATTETATRIARPAVWRLDALGTVARGTTLGS